MLVEEKKERETAEERWMTSEKRERKGRGTAYERADNVLVKGMKRNGKDKKGHFTKERKGKFRGQRNELKFFLKYYYKEEKKEVTKRWMLGRESIEELGMWESWETWEKRTKNENMMRGEKRKAGKENDMQK